MKIIYGFTEACVPTSLMQNMQDMSKNSLLLYSLLPLVLFQITQVNASIFVNGGWISFSNTSNLNVTLSSLYASKDHKAISKMCTLIMKASATNVGISFYIT